MNFPRTSQGGLFSLLPFPGHHRPLEEGRVDPCTTLLRRGGWRALAGASVGGPLAPPWGGALPPHLGGPDEDLSLCSQFCPCFFPLVVTKWMRVDACVCLVWCYLCAPRYVTSVCMYLYMSC